ncbi:MAG: hypothetical protein ABIS86_02295 [Streptosporangiaceae bacterium]
MTEGSTPPSAEKDNTDAPALSPTRPDGWPDWLGRRPIPTTERDKLRERIDADRYARDTTRAETDLQLTPHFSYLVIDGLTEEDQPRKRAHLRARISIATRLAAGESRTHYETTEHRITIGIAGPDARDQILALRKENQRIGRGRRWIITEELT